MENQFAIILILIAAVIFIIFTLLGLRYFMNNVIYRKSPFRDTMIAKDIIINSEWSEYNTENLIDIEHDRYFIGIRLEPPYEILLAAGGIKVPNGEIINPEIKLIDENNHEYLIPLSGSRGEKIAHYEYDGKLPSGTIYKNIYIRSSYPIKATELLWSTLDRKDSK